MKFWQAFVRSQFPIAILAGVLWALAFPKPGLAGLAWIAPALLAWSASGRRGWAAWRRGYVGGLTFYLVSLHWLLYIPLQGAPILGWLALSAYMAIYPATWVWLCWKIFPGQRAQAASARVAADEPEHGESRAVASQKVRSGWRELAGSIQSLAWGDRLKWTLICAAAWTALEFLSSNLFGGFPWNLLAASQYRMTPLIQLAATTGVWGVSFMIVWVSMSLLCAGSAVLGRPGTRSMWLPEVVLPFAAMTLVFGGGLQRMLSSTGEKRPLKIALIQPSIPQTMIWDSRENQRRFEALIRLTQQALTNQPDLLVWPESAVPKMVRYDEATSNVVSEIARTNNVWLILNSDDAERRPDQSEPDYFNGAFLINRQGELAGKYYKQQLVIFGEYVPFARWFPFLRKLAPVEDYAAGKGPVSFELGDLGLRASVLICFEDMFPNTARAATTEATDFLVNLTNDGWFGESSEQWQQAAGAVFRAVENGRPLIRCTNNGLTCWVDEFGRIRQRLDNTAQGIYGEGFLVALVDLPRRDTSTLYHRWGEWFAWACTLMTAIGLLSWGRLKR